MSLKSQKVLEVPVTISSKENILEEVENYLKLAREGIGNRKKEINPLVIFTPNPEIIEYAQGDSSLKKVLSNSDINLPDGMGVVWAVNRGQEEKITRISGVDMIKDIVSVGGKQHVTIGLIGGKNGVALKASKCLAQGVQNARFEVFEVGEILFDKNTEDRMQNTDKKNLNSEFSVLNSKIIDDCMRWIQTKKIGILFVALGFPKQEFFINSLEYRIQNSEYRNPLVPLLPVWGIFAVRVLKK
jgi:exopolysaccharide biosynthesis WecB/TagA/CpsF family protein